MEPRIRRPASSPNRGHRRGEAAGDRGAGCVGGSPGWTTGRSAFTRRCARSGMHPVPSTASLSRIFREAGVARVEPRKKPRASYRRFVYPAPNACWQLDATEYVLTGGRKCVIFQLIDDHSRFAVASHVAWGETSEARDRGREEGITAHGVPQRLLTDNGAALNPSRRGVVGQLVTYVTRARGRADHRASPISRPRRARTSASTRPCSGASTSSPSPTPSKSCRSRSTSSTVIYNTERPHQGLPGRITPLQAWDGDPKADPPRPREPAAPGRLGRRSAAPASPATASSRSARPGSTSPGASPARPST